MKILNDGIELLPPFIGRINILRLAVLTRVIYGLDAISHKISIRYFIELEESTKKVHMEIQKTTIAKLILIRKNTAESIKLAQFKLHCTSILTKTAWYMYKVLHIDLQNRIENQK